MGLSSRAKRSLAKAPHPEQPEGEPGSEWVRSRTYHGGTFERDGQHFPCIMSYNSDAHETYTWAAFVLHGLLPSMHLDDTVWESTSPWVPVKSIKSLAEVQSMVEGVLAHIAKHVLHEGCRTCGAHPTGSDVQAPFVNYLQLKSQLRNVQPACMPAQSKRRKNQRGGDKGWSVLPSGYITVYMGVRRRGEPGRRKWEPVRELAHRMVCWAFNGPPVPGQECAHLCGYANCLAPLHLKWVSSEQNKRMRDWHAVKGRMGELCPDVVWALCNAHS